MSEEAPSTVEISCVGDVADFRSQLADDVRKGLTSQPKELPPKYFYDAVGSALFDRITTLPEYYPTRAETAILEQHADEIVGALRPVELLEIGSGYSRKTLLLLDALERHGGERYAAFDVSEDALRGASARLAAAHPWLRVRGFVGDFETDLAEVPRAGTRLVAFLGSTIGNLEERQRAVLLAQIRGMLEDGDRFLLGVDLVKPIEILEAAYDDAQGVTAEFNRNVLRVVNRELDGDLPVEDFAHRAFFDEKRERIEMWLRATRPIEARLAAIGLGIVFEEGEELRTEISCKFRREKVERELAAAGLRLERWLTDQPRWFALAVAAPA